MEGFDRLKIMESTFRWPSQNRLPKRVRQRRRRIEHTKIHRLLLANWQSLAGGELEFSFQESGVCGLKEADSSYIVV